MAEPRRFWILVRDLDQKPVAVLDSAIKAAEYADSYINSTIMEVQEIPKEPQ